MGNETSTEGRTKESGIVVVTNKKEDQKDQHLPQLEYCPTFQPLLRTSLNIPESRPLSSELIKPISNDSCLELCVHLQGHLEQCSEAVKFDQVSLASRIKEVDRVSTAVMQKLTERQRAFAKYAEHTRKIEDISSTLTRVRMNLNQTLHLVDDLNMLLPQNLRLEKFQV